MWDALVHAGTRGHKWVYKVLEVSQCVKSRIQRPVPVNPPTCPRVAVKDRARTEDGVSRGREGLVDLARRPPQRVALGRGAGAPRRADVAAALLAVGSATSPRRARRAVLSRCLLLTRRQRFRCVRSGL